MFDRQQNAMAYVRIRPTRFIHDTLTVTTNSKWLEILESLTPGQQSHDLADLLVRAFRLKIKNVLKILKDGCFGCLKAPVLNFISVVYHMHIFFFGCHMMPNSISVTIFTVLILFAYTVPKPQALSL